MAFHWWACSFNFWGVRFNTCQKKNSKLLPRSTSNRCARREKIIVKKLSSLACALVALAFHTNISLQISALSCPICNDDDHLTVVNLFSCILSSTSIRHTSLLTEPLHFQTPTYAYLSPSLISRLAFSSAHEPSLYLEILCAKKKKILHTCNPSVNLLSP